MELIQTLATNILLFGVLGLGLEVVFTSLYDFFIGRRDQRFLGYSSFLYVPLYTTFPYGIAIVNYLVYVWMGSTFTSSPILVKYIVYAVSFPITEYIGMYLYTRLLGFHPSEEKYRLSRWSINGFTDLRNAPFFGLAGLIFEYVYRLLY